MNDPAYDSVLLKMIDTRKTLWLLSEGALCIATTCNCSARAAYLTSVQRLDREIAKRIRNQ